MRMVQLAVTSRGGSCVKRLARAALAIAGPVRPRLGAGRRHPELLGSARPRRAPGRADDAHGPLPRRRRLPALPLRRAGRRADGLLGRARPRALRAPEPDLHRPGPPLRHPARRPCRGARRRGRGRHPDHRRDPGALRRDARSTSATRPGSRPGGIAPASRARGRWKGAAVAVGRRHGPRGVPAGLLSRRGGAGRAGPRDGLDEPAARRGGPRLRRRRRACRAGSAAPIRAIAARSSAGPYLESRFFGEGIGLLVRKDDEVLRRTLDYGLQQLWDEGKYAEIYLRFFPVSPF